MTGAIKKLRTELALQFKAAREAHLAYDRYYNEAYLAARSNTFDAARYQQLYETMVIAEKTIQSRFDRAIYESRAGSTEAIAVLIAYLAVADHHHKSGLNKEIAARTLRSLSLTIQQAKETIAALAIAGSLASEAARQEFAYLQLHIETHILHDSQ